MRNSLHVTCVKVYIYISLFWRCYCKCGVLGKQLFFLSLSLSFLFFFFSSFFKKAFVIIISFDITLEVGQAKPTTNVKKKMYNTHCIVRLIHRYTPCRCCSVETHGYIFLDLHKQTDWLYKLLDNQKNHTNREQSLTLTIYLYTITLTVKAASHLALVL